MTFPVEDDIARGQNTITQNILKIQSMSSAQRESMAGSTGKVMQPQEPLQWVGTFIY